MDPGAHSNSLDLTFKSGIQTTISGIQTTLAPGQTDLSPLGREIFHISHAQFQHTRSDRRGSWAHAEAIWVARPNQDPC